MRHPLVLLRAVLLLAPPPLSGVLCLCVERLHHRACVLLRSPPPWSGVRCWSVSDRHGRVCCVGAGPHKQANRQSTALTGASS